MSKLNLNNISAGFASTAALNANFDAIETAIENALSRDGTTPNHMTADLDMNGRGILNLAALDVESLTINGTPVTFPELSVSEIPSQTGHNSKFLQTNGTVVSWQAPDAAEVTFSSTETGAVSRLAQEKMEDIISVKDFGAVGDGLTDDTTAIQTAIDTGKTLRFPQGTYLCNNLTQDTMFQRFIAEGQVTLVKNANGPILTSTADYVEFESIQFNGDAASPTYTGDNLVLEGNHPRLLNCGSQWAYGCAVKATGSHVQIVGTCGKYQTTDATATGYDIEIGKSGTATLYHSLIGVYTSQATGGIKFIDTGSQFVNGCQFGKLTIAAGTKPAGVNGGIYTGSRILGTVTVEQSTAVFTGNQFSTQTITFAATTSNHYLDSSNSVGSATIINNGNSNSIIVKSTGTGSPGGQYWQYGSDASNSTIRYTSGDIYLTNSSLNLPNNKSLTFADAGGTQRTAISFSSGDDWTIGSDTGSSSGNFMTIAAGSGGIYLYVDGTSRFQATASTFRPVADDAYHLGSVSNRFKTVYATTGTINTSDIREKQNIEELDERERRVAKVLKSLIKKFKFKNAVREKNDKARIHIGVIAQEVVAAFNNEGLDANDYGLLCYDEWEDTEEQPKGSRYGIRYEELLAFIISSM